MNTQYETLLTTAPVPGVLLVTLNRPDVANAFNTRMAEELAQLFEEFATTGADCRCIVLTGSGARAFCAGADLKERGGMTDEAWSAQHVVIERMIRGVLDCPPPVIAVVNGAAYGGGCELALACDFIYATSEATFAVPEVTRGIMPGAGGTQTLPRAIGSRAALEMLLTGQPITASEAQRMGLVNAVCSGGAIEQALATAERIAGNAPLAVREIKRAVYGGSALQLTDALVIELEGYNRLVPTQDRREGVRAFNERRSPRFRGH